jgi:hypothetical protein
MFGSFISEKRKSKSKAKHYFGMISKESNGARPRLLFEAFFLCN